MNTISKYLSAAALALICTGVVGAQETAAKFPLIPYPAQLTAGEGSFTITSKTAIVNAGAFYTEAYALKDLLRKGLGTPVEVSKVKKAHAINLIFDASITTPEAYRMSVTKEQVVIRAKDPAGVFHAVETIRQLLPVGIEAGVAQKQLSLPVVAIEDAPVYEWRGMHLDVSRHFFSVSYLKKFIDRMALYKMNKLHLHLTDDQGWRIEIKKYPLLTEAGAWRTFNNQDSACMKKAKDNPDFVIDKEHIIQKNGKTLYGGFYTQEEMKGVVAYAAARHIDIVPEIDMPGHMMAAINSYPFLTCDGENKWGELFTKPICPCNESTFEFAENVFTEIMQIFPSKYIHIGGDEVDRTNWGKSDACKALMAKEGIKDLAGLHSYFINRMEKFFNAKGRKLIGWDEVIEGGISPTAIIMYWRTWVPDAPVKAVKNGNTVIMTPGEPLYFDNQPDQYSVSKVYHFNPVPKVLNAEEAKSIIGAQANLWSEMIPSEKRADYMYMPRLTALSEMLWTHKESEYDSYLERLTQQYKRMDAMKINYRLPDLPNLLNQYVFTDEGKLSIASPLPSLTIRYTTDGSLPDSKSPVLPSPLTVSKSELVRVAAFTPTGTRGDVYNLNYTQQQMLGPVKIAPPKPGLKATYYKEFFKKTALMQNAKVDSTFSTDKIEVPATVKAPSFGITYKGYIDVPTDGIYSFYLTCDDGGVLYIGDKTVVDNDGNHSAQERSGQVALKMGVHPFKLDFIEGGGGFKLLLKYSVDGSAPQDVPSSWFKN
ncbi:family 20 glycosylhydrolase [Mucilaginibacter rubeus]|uniref:beta-N-acetylhexosaminidase n=1 Tax=Mucilaginibacter rubeus TaxID=2027860 RepID=A0AAE6JD77_9SPHI|nr:MULTISPECIES: family 20 glycosylhydrolase [Mucilaginibacter]QEM03271.1 family 20 glycosylhydrolase [Mucilaginibacter rubeus]QEM15889.1 family 20 glycosylhydrolase [Mucilaginibacter gossypii]QTE41370.1 family 20 glycosylhydrolase [Mucilaginibacter rubeus]QTE47974.1 family 20 glycosylhydrolase [Mucilaginibacter rubeus]QTE59367.1 family 20 glycosylhydrolase [Mucilaginibacter rubeus]